MIPTYAYVLDAIKSVMGYLVCLDILECPYNRKTLNIFTQYFSSNKYFIFRKIILWRHKDRVLSYFNNVKLQDYISGSGGPFRHGIYFQPERFENLSNSFKNIVVEYPAMFSNIETIVIKNGDMFILEFALKTRDMNISRRKLFAAISDSKVRNEFVQEFAQDKEIEKLASLV
jgi:hypothetical protein